MRKIPAVLIASAVAIVPFAPAMAQDGFHVEVQGGYDHLAIPDQTGNAPGATVGGGRGVYGFGAGYDVPLGGPLVIGLDSNLDFGGGSSCTAGVVAAGDQLCGKLTHDWDIGARLGVHAGPALIYGRVAYDDTRFSTSYTDPLGNFTATSGSAQGTRLGGGVEYAIVPGIYSKVEYRYTTAAGVPDQNQVIAGLGVRF